MVDNCIIIGSLGRAGSTLLYSSVVNSMGYNPRESQFCVNLDKCKLKSRAVYKTHDFPPIKLPDYAKVIWTFADPYEIVLSVIRQEEKEGINWIKNHFKHLHSDFYKYDDIFDYDAMRLEEHFDGWHQEQNFNLITVKYRSLWDYQKELSRFIGSDINLPPKNIRKKRFGTLDNSIQNRMIDTYGDLYEKVFSADEFRKF